MNDKKKVIRKNGQIFAIVIRSSYRPDGVNFLTPNSYTLQIGFFGHPADIKIKDHVHNPHINYKVDTTQEFIYVESGRIRATIFDFDWKVIDSVELKKGDSILQVSGGHGFEILEPSYLIEVKQGPFPGDKFMKFYREN